MTASIDRVRMNGKTCYWHFRFSRKLKKFCITSIHEVHLCLATFACHKTSHCVTVSQYDCPDCTQCPEAESKRAIWPHSWQAIILSRAYQNTWNFDAVQETDLGGNDAMMPRTIPAMSISINKTPSISVVLPMSPYQRCQYWKMIRFVNIRA